MDTEDLGSDNSGDWEAVEHVNKCLPCLDITPSLAFVIKAVHCTGHEPNRNTEEQERR